MAYGFNDDKSKFDLSALDNVIDYIVEQGTSGAWVYRKFASGIFECWAVQTVNVPINTGGGGGYYHICPDFTFPVTFDYTPFCYCTIYSSQQTTNAICTFKDETKTRATIYRPTANSASVQYNIQWYIRGKVSS